MRWMILASVSLSLVGCFSSKSTRCDATKTCFAADSLGCCDGRAAEVSVCEACPSGMIERSECRVTGCEERCEVPLNCRQDLGDDCCGAPVFTESCEVCPAGSRPVSECTAGFIPTCGCPETVESDAGAPLPDAGADRRPSPDAGAAEPPAACFTDLGEGCCGEYVGEPTSCGCPTGSIFEYECTGFPAPGLLPPTEACREVLFEGCCGGIVERNACSGACPAGSVEESRCGEINDRSGGGAPPSEDEARPAPIPCYEVDELGCCGAEVEPSACTGSCPPGTTTDCIFGGACGA